MTLLAYHCELEDEFVESHYKYFKNVGITPDHRLIEELLYQTGKAGLEGVNSMRYCKANNKKGFEIYKTIEAIGHGKNWESQYWYDGELYILGCNHVE